MTHREWHDNDRVFWPLCLMNCRGIRQHQLIEFRNIADRLLISITMFSSFSPLISPPLFIFDVTYDKSNRRTKSNSPTFCIMYHTAKIHRILDCLYSICSPTSWPQHLWGLWVSRRGKARRNPWRSSSIERGLPYCEKTFTEPHNKGVCRSQLGQEDRTRENFHPLQGEASVPHCKAAVPRGQDKVSWHQEEPAPLLSALCIGEPRHVFEGRKAEGVLHDNGISAPFFPNFPVKRAIRGRKRGNESSIARSFVLQFVKFVSADQLAVIIHYLSVIP